MEPPDTEVHRCIRARRSVKPALMDGRPVERPLLETLLEQARWAPTHGLTQPWFFHVYTGDARAGLAEKLQQFYLDQTSPAEFRDDKLRKLGEAPLQAGAVLAVCLRRDPRGRIPEIEEIASVACAVQNMHLAASACGLGAFWSTPPVVYSEAMRHWLQLGPGDRCLGLFYLGWPREGAPPPPPRDPMAGKVVWHA